MKQFLTKFKNNKKGFLSLFTIIMLSVLLPFLIFVFVTFTNMIQNVIYFKNVSDNAASSAVVLLNETKLQDGILYINETQAIARAKEVIAKELNLDADLSPNENSKVYEKPNVEVLVYNDVPTEGLEIMTRFGKKIKVYKPSVIVVAEYPTLNITKSDIYPTIKNVGVAQTQFVIH